MIQKCIFNEWQPVTGTCWDKLSLLPRPSAHAKCV